MFQIIIYKEEHGAGDIHYHMSTEVGQKKVFMRFKEKLPELLPKGFQTHYYHENDIGILDENKRSRMHICYVQRHFPHNLHLHFNQDSFKPIFTEMLQKCFPKAKIEWIEESEK